MQALSNSDWLLGTIGFAYPDWARVFYPKGVSGPSRLTYYAQLFDAVEIDATFHAVPARSVVRRWREAVPSEFRFCLKAPREISHGPDAGHLGSHTAHSTMCRFLDTASELGDTLAMTLLQFPASFTPDRADELFRFLDRYTPHLPIAVELRHDGWWSPETATAFRGLNVCWVTADEPAKTEAHAPPTGYRPRPIVATTSDLYIRWIGQHEQFPDLATERLDPTARLAWWSERLRAVLQKRSEITRVLGFFGNGFSGYAPATCRRFCDQAALEPRGPEHQASETAQPTLFAARQADHGSSGVFP